MQIEQWPIDKPVQYARNARNIGSNAIDKVAASLKEFGFRQPIVVDEEGVILVGHTRLAAAKKLGMTEVPIHIARGLNKAQAKAYRLMDNRSHEEATWDNDLLKIEFAEIAEFDIDISMTGFGQDEIDLLFAPDPTDGLTDPDDVPDAPEEPVSKLGDVWVLGNHRLMCGNSTAVTDVDRLMMGAKADMVFTDPPYGVDYDGGHFHSGNVNIKRKRERLAGDATTQIYTDVIPVLAAYCNGPCYTWFADTKPIDLFNAVDMVGEIHAMIVWHKTNATYAAMNAQYKQRHEPCLYWKPKGKTLMWCGSSTEATIWEMKKDGKNNFHPTQKPVELAARAISNHTAKTVLDLFGGSGSTLIACEQTGRKCYMMELNPSYVDVIVKRWEDFTGQKASRE